MYDIMDQMMYYSSIASNNSDDSYDEYDYDDDENCQHTKN